MNAIRQIRRFGSETKTFYAKMERLSMAPRAQSTPDPATLRTGEMVTSLGMLYASSISIGMNMEARQLLLANLKIQRTT